MFWGLKINLKLGPDPILRPLYYTGSECGNAFLNLRSDMLILTAPSKNRERIFNSTLKIPCKKTVLFLPYSVVPQTSEDARLKKIYPPYFNINCKLTIMLVHGALPRQRKAKGKQNDPVTPIRDSFKTQGKQPSWSIFITCAQMQSSWQVRHSDIQSKRQATRFIIFHIAQKITLTLLPSVLFGKYVHDNIIFPC